MNSATPALVNRACQTRPVHLTAPVMLAILAIKINTPEVGHENHPNDSR